MAIALDRPFVTTLRSASAQARGLVFWVPGAPTQAPFSSFAPHLRMIGTPRNGIDGRHLKGGIVTGSSYDGVNDRIDFANPYNTTSGFTFMAWVHPDTLVRATSQFIWCSHVSGDGNQAAVVYVFGDGATSGAIGCNITRDTSAMVRITQSSFAGTSWQHIAVNYDGGTAASGINIYRNSIPAASYLSSGNGVGALTAGTGSYAIGGRIFDDARNYDGGIADVRLYNRVIGQAELRKHFDPQTRWELYWQPSTRTYFQIPLDGYIPDPAAIAFSGLSAGLQYQINMPDEA
jgi:hypothetical protein